MRAQDQNVDCYFDTNVIIQLKSEISKVWKEARKRAEKDVVGTEHQ
jgi:hypothetical protein